MLGNVYVKFSDEEEAEKCIRSLAGKYYAGKIIHSEYCPVTDFKEARCRQHDEAVCDRGPLCNFMHVKQPSRELSAYLLRKYRFKPFDKSDRVRRGRDRSRSRSRSRNRDYRYHRRRDSRDRGRDPYY